MLTFVLVSTKKAREKKEIKGTRERSGRSVTDSVSTIPRFYQVRAWASPALTVFTISEPLSGTGSAKLNGERQLK